MLLRSRLRWFSNSLFASIWRGSISLNGILKLPMSAGTLPVSVPSSGDGGVIWSKAHLNQCIYLSPVQLLSSIAAACVTCL